MTNTSWKWPIIFGVLLGVPAAGTVANYIGHPMASDTRAVATEKFDHQADHETLRHIVDRHLTWAKDESDAGLISRLMPITDFFDEARNGTRVFAEDVLSLKSKFILVRDYAFDGKQHEEFMAERFAACVFAPEELERLVHSSIRTYLQLLSEVDYGVLVRLQADIEEIPNDALPDGINRMAIQQSLEKAIRDAVRAVEVDLRRNVGRELVSYVAGEVLSTAAVELATSTGILGIGASTGTVTAGMGFVLSVIVDRIIAWAYEKLYDPVGEITDRLNKVLSKLEELILDGDGDQPGLVEQLRDVAQRRNGARGVAIRAALAP
jgi:hypothetical protein